MNKFFNDDSERLFCVNQTDSTLKSNDVVDRASSILDAHSVRHHSDKPKNWDNLLSLFWTTELLEDIDAAVIIDVGSTTPESAYLPSLRDIYHDRHRLMSMNVDGIECHDDGIEYHVGDITDTGLPSGSVDFISCLSVIEHGVDVDCYIHECYRILKPGGMVFTSTDFWSSPVDTKGARAFGAPVKIFNQDDISHITWRANRTGFIYSDMDMECMDKVIHWSGVDYTFINFLLVKPS